MPTTTWIVVANARHARIFAQHGPNKALELIRESELPADAAERPEFDGRASPRHGDPARSPARSFAHRLGSELCAERSRGTFARAVLVAPPAFMGLLNAELDAPTASLVTGRLDKDYTRSDSHALASHLGECLCV